MKERKAARKREEEVNAADRRLLADLDRILEGLESPLLAEFIAARSGEDEDDDDSAPAGPGDDALPFLIFVSTRWN